MSSVCPLIFDPIFKPKVWGGRHLAAYLGKKLPDGQSIGESWECADLDGGQSVVARGPETGRTLHQLLDDWRADLLGNARPIEGRFPLLIKFLDAAEPLSIQVHPDEKAAEVMGLCGAVKHEAWHIVHAEPGARIFRGLRQGTSILEVGERLKEDPQSLITLLQAIPVKEGDTYFLPSGTIHALGAGVLAAEVQTPSDVTYRLYDWGRTRPASDAGLHIEQALACIRTDLDFAAFEKRAHVTSVFTTVTRVVTCPSFIIEKVRFAEGVEQEIPFAEPVCWIVLDGHGEILFNHVAQPPSAVTQDVLPFSRGDVVLVPAALKNGRVKTVTPCTWLEVTIPVTSNVASEPPADSRTQFGKAGGRGGFVPLRIEGAGGMTRFQT